jgi:hypothetical protein
MIDEIVNTAIIEAAQGPWWGDYRLALEESLLWEIGPFELQVSRRKKEWIVWHQLQNFAEAENDKWTLKKNLCLNDEKGDSQRYLFDSTEELLRVSPRLADRPVIIKALKPLHIQANQHIDLYVSSPLWFSVSVHANGAELLEIPIIRPSDTWFGPSTMKGELCYASNTQGRLNLANVPLRPHRAISPIKIKNQTDKSLHLTQLSLPAPYLSLFDTGESGLWTEEVTFLNDDTSGLAKVTFSENPPQPFNAVAKITNARLQKEKNMLLHTFSTLFN